MNDFEEDALPTDPPAIPTLSEGDGSKVYLLRQHECRVHRAINPAVAVVAPSDEQVLANIRNKEKVLAETLRPSDKVPVFTLAPYRSSNCFRCLACASGPPGIEATKAAQQRNAERLVRERAYFLWEDAGCPNGRDVEFWLEAERRFLAWTRQICTAAEYHRLAGATT